MRKEHLDTEEFWIIGDFLGKVFAKWGGNGHGCYIDSSDPAKAERFDSYRQARRFCRDDDIVEWKKSQRDPKAVRPLRCRVQVVVYGPGMKP
jgi:hypothetical protein